MIKKKEGELSGVNKQFEETISKLESNVARTKREVSQAIEEIITKIRERGREKIQFLEHNTRVETL